MRTGKQSQVQRIAALTQMFMMIQTIVEKLQEIDKPLVNDVEDKKKQ